MAISVRCPNGHDLRVKDEFAGKSGLCPHCRCRIQVPMPVNIGDPGQVSDDDVLAMLGPGTKFAKPPVEEPEAESPDESRATPVPAAPQEPARDDAPGDESAMSLLSAAILQRQKSICPHCKGTTSVAFTHCPRCGTRLNAPPSPPGRAKQ
ncbi:MAG: hypothetical protein ABSF26_23470 [Thermoguttaceae bacterium]|jgi:ribosomal protein L40E